MKYKLKTEDLNGVLLIYFGSALIGVGIGYITRFALYPGLLSIISFIIGFVLLIGGLKYHVKYVRELKDARQS